MIAQRIVQSCTIKVLKLHCFLKLTIRLQLLKHFAMHNIRISPRKISTSLADESGRVFLSCGYFVSQQRLNNFSSDNSVKSKKNH